ncbi:MAG: hypothetical protein AABM64_16425 [Pseudomonadota bacterium]
MREVAFVLLGMLIGLLPPWFIRKRRLKTHWCALRAEIVQCNEKATTIFTSVPLVMAPLYRLPQMTYQSSFPVLLADGAVSESEVRVLGRFFSQVQDINRGLDNAAEMNKADKLAKLEQEFDRNCLKAKGLVQPQDQESSLYAQAMTVVNRKAHQSWWRYANHA